MSLVPITPPSVEPVTLDEAKLHCRVDHSEDDAVITALIAAARVMVEQDLERALLPQTWEWRLDAFPLCRALRLPMRPLRSVVSVTYLDQDGASTTLAPERYQVSGVGASAGGMLMVLDAGWPATACRLDAVTIRFQAGYDLPGAGTLVAGQLPTPIRQAVLLLVGHWNDNRTPETDTFKKEYPFGVSALLAPFRTFV